MAGERTSEKGGMGDDGDDGEDDGELETSKLRTISPPSAPSKEKWELHMLTHSPYRSLVPTLRAWARTKRQTQVQYWEPTSPRDRGRLLVHGER